MVFRATVFILFVGLCAAAPRPKRQNAILRSYAQSAPVLPSYASPVAPPAPGYSGLQPGYGVQTTYGVVQNAGGQTGYGVQPVQTGYSGGQSGYGGVQTVNGGGQTGYGLQSGYGSQAGNAGGQTGYGGQTTYGGGGSQTGYGVQSEYGSQNGYAGGQTGYSGQTSGIQSGYGGQSTYGSQRYITTVAPDSEEQPRQNVFVLAMLPSNIPIGFDPRINPTAQSDSTEENN